MFWFVTTYRVCSVEPSMTAHCNADIVTNQVYIGNTILSNISEGGTSKTIVQRSVHPNYNWRTLENDYLVMKINSNATQRPIPMNANPDYPVTGEILTVIGFGTLTNGGKAMSPTLQQVNVTAFSQTSCNTSYPKQIDQNTMLCAGVTGGGRDSCKGDSGGPLFDNNGTLVGLVSWGNQCALAGYPGVYARISGGYSWINHQICEMSSYPPEWCPRKKRVSRRKPTRFPSPATAAPVQPHS